MVMKKALEPGFYPGRKTKGSSLEELPALDSSGEFHIRYKL